MSLGSGSPILHRLFTTASTMSLVLFLITVAARAVVPAMPRNAMTRQKTYTLPNRSRVIYNYGLTRWGVSFDRSRELLPGMTASPKRLADLDGFGFRMYSGSGMSAAPSLVSGRTIVIYQQFEYFSLLVPYWLIALLAIVLPLAYVSTLLPQLTKRHRGNLCRACGYDLRATPDRCPECGRQAANAPLTASTPHPETHTPPSAPPP